MFKGWGDFLSRLAPRRLGLKSSAKVQHNGSALWVKVGLRGKTPDKTRKSRSKCGNISPCAGRSETKIRMRKLPRITRMDTDEEDMLSLLSTKNQRIFY